VVFQVFTCMLNTVIYEDRQWLTKNELNPR